ncbi:MAG TPA: hypothetical protein VKU87_09310 [Thermomicrobiaceae bacterium]|nr:hypothetical protein [Thermomicrobiaceae bacterium]
MIVRISGDGQYRIDEGYLDEINKVDNDLAAAISNDDEDKFYQLLKELLSIVHEHGVSVPVEELVASDIILPPADTTWVEALKLFSGEGIIPG